MAVTGTVTTAGLIVTGHQGGDGSASRGKGLGGTVTKGTRGSWKGGVPPAGAAAGERMEEALLLHLSR